MQRVQVEVRVYRISRSLQTACAGAPSLADTLAACARPPAQSHLRFSMVENRSRRSPAINMRASIGGSGIARSANRLRRCAIARRPLSQTCAPARAGTAAPPLHRWSKIGRVAAHANMRATTEGAEILRSGNSLPRRAIALGYSPRPCAGSRKHRRPRLSMVENRSPSRAHTNMRATTEGAEIPRSGKRLPRRAIALGHSPRPCAGSRKHRRPRFIDGRKSVASRRTPICVQRPRGPKSRGPVTACPVAPSLSATLADRAPARASTADPVHRWSKIGRVARPRQYACNDRGGRNPEVR